MPLLHNPADFRLFCYRIERFLDAGETVEITDDEAADLEGNTVFVIERDETPAKPAAPAEPEAAEEPAEEPAEADEGATAARKVAKRGSKQVEVTEAPERETRAKGLTTRQGDGSSGL